MHNTCSAQGCTREGDDCYDHYGIYAGRYCEQHESQAPGQWAYNADGELSNDELYGEEE